MNPIIIVEGVTDQMIIERLLPQDLLDKAQIVLGRGRSNAQSLARSILSTKRRPIVLIQDADTTNQANIDEQRDFSQWYLNRGTVDVPFKTILAVPSIEVVLFHNKPLLETLLNRQFTEMEWKLAQSQPAQALKNLSDDYHQFLRQLLHNLSDEQAKILASHAIIQELEAFLKELTPNPET